jgi:hypothetical protein
LSKCFQLTVLLSSGVFRSIEGGHRGLEDESPRSWSILKEIDRNFYAKIELKCYTFKNFAAVISF